MTRQSMTLQIGNLMVNPSYGCIHFFRMAHFLQIMVDSTKDEMTRKASKYGMKENEMK